MGTNKIKKKPHNMKQNQLQDAGNIQNSFQLTVNI